MSDDSLRPKSAQQARARPVLWVRFSGVDISPERVSLGMLSRALSAIGQLSSGESPGMLLKRGESADPGPFQLIGVNRGSAIYSFGGSPPPAALERLRAIGKSLVSLARSGARDSRRTLCW